MDECIELKKNYEEEGKIYNCNCLNIDYPNRKKYIDYVSIKYNITDKLLHTLYLSNRKQLRSFIRHNYNFDINELD